jgi:hypothetical protein
MARRPLAFGIRFRDKGRTLRVRGYHGTERGYVLEDARPGRPVRVRSHGTLGGALRDFAATWRARLN